MKIDDGKCARCAGECDGTFMRMDARYTRVRNLLTAPEVPRFSGGGIAMCHWCQRAIYWRKDFIKLLIDDLKRAATGDHGLFSKGSGSYTYDPRQEMWDKIIELAPTGITAGEIAEQAGCETTTVYDVMRKYGLPTKTEIRQESKRQSKLEAFGIDKAKKVVEMRKGGQSWYTIGAILGEPREKVMAAHINMTGDL